MSKIEEYEEKQLRKYPIYFYFSLLSFLTFGINRCELRCYKGMVADRNDSKFGFQ